MSHEDAFETLMVDVNVRHPEMLEDLCEAGAGCGPARMFCHMASWCIPYPACCLKRFLELPDMSHYSKGNTR